MAQRLEAGYRGNPYHNGTHAADVVQGLGALLLGDSSFREALSALELLALVIAAAAHDVGHPGASLYRSPGLRVYQELRCISSVKSKF